MKEEDVETIDLADLKKRDKKKRSQTDSDTRGLTE